MSRTHSGNRWVGLRLWIYRGQGEASPVALILRHADGGLYRDRLVARGQAPVPPGGLASTNPDYAVIAGILAIYRPADVLEMIAQLLAEGGSAPLEGPQGDTPPGLDSAAILKNEAAAARAKEPRA
jgi:hypothetical protein